jgi:DNA-binding sugar fermentation-stimulating protein
MKGLVWRNTHVKYKSPTTYQSKVITKVKVFLKKVKLQGQSVEAMVANEGSCQKEYTCEI